MFQIQQLIITRLSKLRSIPTLDGGYLSLDLGRREPPLPIAPAGGFFQIIGERLGLLGYPLSHFGSLTAK